MPAIADLVSENSTSTGTGNFTLAAAPGYRRFSTVFGTGGTPDVFWYFISNLAQAEWEVGSGHMSATNTLVRDTVLASSNSNSKVNFSAGDKVVVNDLPSTRQVDGDTLGALAPGDDASDVPFTPAGGLSSTDVQSALVEIDSEKLAAGSYTASDVLEKLTTVGRAAVNVARPSKWGNPFVVAPACPPGRTFSGAAFGCIAVPTIEDAVACFREMMALEGEHAEALRAALPELRGKNLACWCKPGEPCHAAVLIEIANA